MIEIHRPDRGIMVGILNRDRDRQWVMDTETNGLEVLGPDAPHKAFYIGLMPLGSRHVFIVTRDEFEAWDLREEVERLRLVGHNLRFDLHALNINPQFTWVDTMTAAYFNNTTGKRSMDHIARVHGWSKLPTPDLLKQGRILDVPEEDLFHYLADDCRVTGKMYEALRTEDAAFDYRVDKAVYGMECRGMRLLADKLDAVRDLVVSRIYQTEDTLRMLGLEGNFGSPVQVAAWLEGHGRKLPHTATGRPSTAKLVLQKLADDGDSLAVALLDWRKLTKLKNSFVDPLPQLAQFGVLYPRTNATRTATGRFSCDTPNLQQIPKRGPLGKALRGCLTSPYNNGLTACDFNQIELRVAAAFAKEPVLLDAFAAGQCPHTEVAAKMLGKRPADILPEERFRAKAVNFGILNGMGAKRLALELKTTPAQAKRFLSDYKSNLSKLHEWMEGVWRSAEVSGLARTAAGRTRVFRGGESTRPAISVIVQGSAAELMRAALVAVDEACLLPLLSVHDEILIGGDDPSEAEKLRETMEYAADSVYTGLFADVKFTASATTGETWGDV